MSIKIFPTYVKLLNKYVNQNCKVKGYLTCDINYNLFQNYIYIYMYVLLIFASFLLESSTHSRKVISSSSVLLNNSAGAFVLLAG